MSVEVLDAIKKQTKILTKQEKFSLANFLLEEANSEKIEDENLQIVTDEIRQKRMVWLKENQEKYGGQFVVLDGDKLLGTAKTFVEARKIAVEAGLPKSFVTYLSKPDEEGYLGGF